MNLDDPIPIYDAKNHLEAIQVAQFLSSRGIQAHADEDDSLGGGLGVFTSEPKSQVWVSRGDGEKIAALLAEFDSNTAQQEVGLGTSQKLKATEPITTECEECGKPSTYDAEHDGTVQECPLCHSYVDVGELDWEDQDFGEPEDA